MFVETVKIQTEPSAENPTGIVIINKEDFDEKIHTLFVEKPVAPPQAGVAAIPEIKK
jgi:hypothetical protein